MCPQCICPMADVRPTSQPQKHREEGAVYPTDIQPHPNMRWCLPAAVGPATHLSSVVTWGGGNRDHFHFNIHSPLQSTDFLHTNKKPTCLPTFWKILTSKIVAPLAHLASILSHGGSCALQPCSMKPAIWWRKWRKLKFTRKKWFHNFYRGVLHCCQVLCFVSNCHRAVREADGRSSSASGTAWGRCVVWCVV